MWIGIFLAFFLMLLICFECVFHFSLPSFPVKMDFCCLYSFGMIYFASNCLKRTYNISVRTHFGFMNSPRNIFRCCFSCKVRRDCCYSYIIVINTKTIDFEIHFTLFCVIYRFMYLNSEHIRMRGIKFDAFAHFIVLLLKMKWRKWRWARAVELRS